MKALLGFIAVRLFFYESTSLFSSDLLLIVFDVLFHYYIFSYYHLQLINIVQHQLKSFLCYLFPVYSIFFAQASLKSSNKEWTLYFFRCIEWVTFKSSREFVNKFTRYSRLRYCWKHELKMNLRMSKDKGERKKNHLFVILKYSKIYEYLEMLNVVYWGL